MYIHTGAAFSNVQVTLYAAQFEHRLQQGSKPIFHLEAFLARVMSEYKQWYARFHQCCMPLLQRNVMCRATYDLVLVYIERPVRCVFQISNESDR